MPHEADTARALLAATRENIAWLHLGPDTSNRLLVGMLGKLGALIDEGEYIEALGALSVIQAGLYAAGDTHAV